MVKVMFAENINFNNNARKMLKQIIYELYKFNKITRALLEEKNKDATRAILSSQKFENYVAGIFLNPKTLSNPAHRYSNFGIILWRTSKSFPIY